MSQLAIHTRINSLDAMKAIAALFVVIIHTNPFRGINLPWFNGDLIDYILDTTARFAVPYFFLVSGYLFANSLMKYNHLRKTLVKYLWRILFIHISWGLLYYGPRFIANPSEMLNFERLFKELFWIGFEVHLWFLPALMVGLIGLYIAARQKMIKLLLWVSFVLHIAGMFGDGQIYYSVFQLPLWPTGTRDGIFFGLFYITLGYHLFFNPPSKWMNKFSNLKLFLLLFGVILLQLVERWMAFELHNANPDCDYYLMTIPFSILVFLLCLKNNKWGNSKLILDLGVNSMGIYVIHVAVLLQLTALIDLLDVSFLRNNILWHLVYTPIIYFSAYFIYKYWKSLRVVISKGIGR
ncbi:MAG: acyltransferase [Bacteroidales bacterium]|nr:acyltransferase [Bacteroidales bacterium]